MIDRSWSRTASIPIGVEPADRRRHADRLRDRGRSGLEAGRRVGEGRSVLGHLADHRSAAEERRHLAQQVQPGPEGADARSARRPCDR